MSVNTASESNYAFFRRLFTEHPDLLDHQDNKEILARYRQEHGMAYDEEVSKTVKTSAANMKSQMKKQRAGGNSVSGSSNGVTTAAATSRPAPAVVEEPAAISDAAIRLEVWQKLDLVENEIDELVRVANRMNMRDLVSRLRRAHAEIIGASSQPLHRQADTVTV